MRFSRRRSRVVAKWDGGTARTSRPRGFTLEPKQSRPYDAIDEDARGQSKLSEGRAERVGRHAVAVQYDIRPMSRFTIVSRSVKGKDRTHEIGSETRSPMSSASRAWRVGACATAIMAAVLVGSSGVGAASAGSGAQGPGLFSGHQWTGAGSGSAAHAVAPRTPGLQVVASGLNQPHHLTIGPDGNLYVAEAGDGVIGAGCVMGTEAACANNSGTIDRITPQGAVTHVVTGLPSVGSPGGGVASGGVADVRVVNGKIYAVIQNQNIDPTTGQQTYGPAGALLGDLVSAPLSGGTATSVASFGPYEAANNPDQVNRAGPR